VNAEGDSAIDSTVNTIAENMPKDFNFHYFRIQKGGRAAARNHGIRQSAANVLFFFASDFIATPRLLEHHLTLHEQNSDSKVVGIGPVAFLSKLEMTPFMRWLDESGALFGTKLSSCNTGIPAEFFFGANTSIKKDFLNSVGPFDEELPYHSVDDSEMGHRLFERGMKNVFLPDVLAYHDHQISMEERLKALREAGESTAIIDFRNPRSVSRDRRHACSAGMVRLLEGWYRTGFFLLRREQDLWKYFDMSMTRAWVDGYRMAEKHLRV
jgi:GT2 family glycosyltransferase